jgi:predicted glutamine amidotransferase
MCGIVYQRREDMRPCSKGVLKRYRKQKDRGEDGFGYVSVSEGGVIEEYKRFQDEKAVKRALERSASSHVLFHHRFPTSTPNLAEAAHPIRVSNKELDFDYYVVHNGVINNGDDYKDEHEALGYKYTTEIETQYRTAKGKLFTAEVQYNDSETLAIELARTLEGLQGGVRTKGTIAYIVMQVEKASKKLVATYYGTNGGNPLTVDRTNGILTIASEGGKAIESLTCFRMSDTGEVSTRVLTIPPYQIYRPATTVYGFPDYKDGYTKTIGFGTNEDNEWSLDAADAMERDADPREFADDWIEDDYLEAQIDGCKRDIEIAKLAMEWQELEQLEIEHFELVCELNERRTRQPIALAR